MIIIRHVTLSQNVGTYSSCFLPSFPNADIVLPIKEQNSRQHNNTTLCRRLLPSVTIYCKAYQQLHVSST